MQAQSSLMLQLPQWIRLLEKNIESCENQLQLDVCRDWMDLFYNRYLFVLPVHDLQLHLLNLRRRINKKEADLIHQHDGSASAEESMVMTTAANVYESIDHNLNALFADMQPKPGAAKINDRIHQVFSQLKQLRNLAFVSHLNQTN